MLRNITVLLLGCTIALPAFAQTKTTMRDSSGAVEITFKGAVPTSSASVTTDTVRIDSIILVNNNNATVTCIIKDQSTDCAGSGCSLIPDSISIAALTQYVWPLHFIPANGGIVWSCSTGNVIGRIKVSP